MGRHRMFMKGGGDGRRSSRSGAPHPREVDSAPLRPPPEVPAPWSLRQRALLTLVMTGGLVAWMGFLLSRPGLPYRTHLLDFWSTDKPTHLGLNLRSGGSPMTRVVGPDGTRIHSVEFEEIVAIPRTNLRSMDFLLDVRRGDAELQDWPATAHVIRAELKDMANESVLRPAKLPILRTEQLVEFLREDTSGVERPAGTWEPVGSRWRLEIQTQEDVALALRSLVSSAESGPASTNGGTLAIRVPVAGAGTVRWAYPHGRFTTWTEGDRANRAALLARLWDRGSVAWVVAWLGVAGCLIGLGVWWLPVGAMMGARWRAGCSVALLFGGYSLGYSLMTPPFLGVNEPAHIFSYHRWQGDDDAVKAAWDLGLRTHFARLMYRPHQKFTAGDLGNPNDWFIDHPSTMDTHPASRSAVAARVWEATRFLIRGQSAAVQVWRLRLISLLAAAAGVGLAAWWMAGSGEGEVWVPALGWWLLLIPSLPYFAMNVSNYPFLMALMAITAAGVARMVNAASVPARVPGLLGLTYGLALHTSVSALPLAAAIAAAMAGWFLGREYRTESPGATPGALPNSPRWLGWLCFAGGLLLSRLATNPEYDSRMTGFFGSRLAAAGFHHPPPAWLVVLAVGAIPASVEWMLARRRSRRSSVPRPRRWVAVTGLALALVFGMAINALLPAPQLRGMRESVPLWDFAPGQEQLLPLASLPRVSEVNAPVRDYALGALKSFFASWGPGDADFMLSRLFWQENGDVDSLAPEWERQLLTTFFGLGLVLLFWRIAASANRVRCIRLMAVLAGVVASLVLYAYAARSEAATPSLHGRYLIGLYLVLLAVCFLGWKGLLVHWQERRPGRLALLLGGVPLVLQMASYGTLLERYFGS